MVTRPPQALSVEDRRCPAWDDPVVYSPPPEEQPEPDPGITTAAPAADLLTGAEPVDDLAVTTEEPRPGDGAAASEAARQWAQREARDHFAGVWMDQDHQAAVIAFTADVEAYAAQVRDRFGAGWWVAPPTTPSQSSRPPTLASSPVWEVGVKAPRPARSSAVASTPVGAW